MDIDEFNFEVKESTIPDSGKGVFAKRDFKQGSIICEYKGVLMPIEQYKRGMVGDDRSIGYNDKYQLVGYPDNLGAYINDIVVFREYTVDELKKCIRENKYPMHEGKQYNCDYLGKFNRIWVIATSDIEAGNELFASYGPDYWHARMIEKGWL